MSKRSKRQQRLITTYNKDNQQAILASIHENTPEKPSIGQLVMQRMQKMGLTEDAAKPPIRIADMPLGDVKTVVLPPEEEQEEWPIHWAKCPATCNPMEWRRASEHRDYYLDQQRKDENRRPWFQYPKYNYQYSEFVYCTPEMMEVLLRYMPINRGCKDHWVDAIARDVLNERWLQSHESLAINTIGNFHDGQHRAKGIIKANKSWPLYVTWNVPPEAVFVTDSGERRKVNEKLSFLFPDSKITNKTAALCRSMMWGLSNRGIKYSESEIADFAIKHQKVVQWVTHHIRGFRADVQAVVAKSLLWWGEEALLPFVERLKSVQFVGDGDPAKALYLWLQKSKNEGTKSKSYTGPLIYYKKTLAAVHAYIYDKGANRLHAKEDDVFEWTPGWDVPANAPARGKVFQDDEEE